MLVMLYVGTTNPDKLWKAAKLDRDFVRLRCKRLRDNGVITGPGVFDVDWFDDDWRIGNISFMFDVLTAEGKVVRKGKDKDGYHHYQLTEAGEAAARKL